MKSFSSKMKVNSRRNSNRSIFLQAILVVIIIGLVLWLAGSVLGTVTSVIAKPFYGARTWLFESSGTLPEYFRDRNELLSTITDLEEQVLIQKGNGVVIERLKNENEELKQLTNASSSERIIAAIIAKPPLLPYDALLIDQGSSDGVREGVVVYHYNNRAIGYISKVFPTSALITLFSTPGVEATGYIYGPDIYTTIRGIGGGVVTVSVPQGIALNEGDLVILPFLEVGYIGDIQSVESKPTEPAQIGYIVADIGVQSLRLVSVSTQMYEAVTFEEAQQQVVSQEKRILKINVPADIIIEVSTSTATTTEEALETP